MLLIPGTKLDVIEDKLDNLKASDIAQDPLPGDGGGRKFLTVLNLLVSNILTTTLLI